MITKEKWKDFGPVTAYCGGFPSNGDYIPATIEIPIEKDLKREDLMSAYEWIKSYHPDGNPTLDQGVVCADNGYEIGILPYSRFTYKRVKDLMGKIRRHEDWSDLREDDNWSGTMQINFAD